ncbi:MAG: hypothetical protein FWD47_13395 [Treponema sp.]|nr:hypothetical protein [Treponema sp.]
MQLIFTDNNYRLILNQSVEGEWNKPIIVNGAYTFKDNIAILSDMDFFGKKISDIEAKIFENKIIITTEREEWFILYKKYIVNNIKK